MLRPYPPQLARRPRLSTTPRDWFAISHSAFSIVNPLSSAYRSITLGEFLTSGSFGTGVELERE